MERYNQVFIVLKHLSLMLLSFFHHIFNLYTFLKKKKRTQANLSSPLFKKITMILRKEIRELVPNHVALIAVKATLLQKVCGLS